MAIVGDGQIQGEVDALPTRRSHGPGHRHLHLGFRCIVGPPGHSRLSSRGSSSAAFRIAFREKLVRPSKATKTARVRGGVFAPHNPL